MKIRYQSSPGEVKSMDTEGLRNNFLVKDILQEGEVNLTYSHYDRVIIGGASPAKNVPLNLPNFNQLKADYFMERREMGVINVGGTGYVLVDGKTFSLSKLDCLYIGKGSNNIAFYSDNDQDSAKYFLMSAPAHAIHPTTMLSREHASPLQMGSSEISNQRTIYKYIHQEGLKSCQLVMGLTVLDRGSVWNTMPAHVHDRRMEAYFYFDLGNDQRVFHFMGEPSETRHILVSNHEGILSPPWSIHSGCGTSNYSFIWGMAGENYDFKDMDFVELKDMK